MTVSLKYVTLLAYLQRGETALHMAARAGQVEVVRCLLRNGAMVDARARVRLSLSAVTHQRSVSPGPFCGVCDALFLVVLVSGGPDSPPHSVPLGEDGDRAAAAAAHGPPRRRHHQRLHPAAYLCPGGAGGDLLGAAGGWGFTLTGHQGE